MKKKLSILSLLLLFTMTAMAQTLVDGIYYNLNGSDNTAEVTENKYGIKYSGDIVIPASLSVDGVDYSVTSIGAIAFLYCSGLTSIEIPNSVTSIGGSAFSDCWGLTSIEIPNSVTSIGGSAFCNCSGLTSIVVAADNPVYDSRENCNAIIETATNTLVQGCKETVIPTPVTSIGSGAFEGCSSLTSIEIPNSVTSIGYNAFSGCSSLTSIEIPNSVTSIGDDVFSGCSGLTSIEIPNSVTSIGYNAFSGCSGLTSIEIPNSVTEIGRYAFAYCSGLTSIEIPNSVTEIGDHVFSGCSDLTSIVVAADNPVYDSRENCNAIIETATNTLVQGCKETVIPTSVTSIGSGAFEYCSSLTSIEIPNSVTSIGMYAFSDCSGLTSIEIPTSVTSIGRYAFSRCSGLTSIEIPNSVTEIESYAFASCSGLTSITMQSATPPATGHYSIFQNCSSLKTIYVPNGAAEAYNVAPWNAYNILELANGLYYNIDIENKTSEIIANPNGTKYSGDIIIPANISVNGIDYSVTSIGNEAFRSCPSLISIQIPNSITSIRSFAFLGCTSLTSIEIPKSVTLIEEGTFSFCPGLTNIIVETDNLVYDSRKNCNAIIETVSNKLVQGCKETMIPNSVTSIGNYAFADCDGLTTIEIPNSVTSIGNYAFVYCSGLTSIEIPNSVTSIGVAAFYSCSGLTSIEIPNSVTTIESAAFYDCSSLKSLTMQASTPPATSAAVFYACNNLETIYVPTGAAEAYNVAPWNAYNIIESAPEVSEVTFDFKGNPWGLPLGSGSGETAGAGNVEEITQDGVALTFDQATASTPARMWTGPQLRVYKNSNVTVKAPAGKVVTKAVWTATDAKYFGLTVGEEVLDAAAGWTGAQAEVTFLVTVNGRYNTLVVTLANEGTEPTPDPEVPEDAPNYEPRHNGTKTVSYRPVTAVKLIGESSGEQIYSLTSTEQSQDFTDVTASVVFQVEPGEKLTPVVEHDAFWMNHAVYIDTDKNGFTGAIEAGSEWKPAGDLVSYSFYNNGAASDESGWNSIGDVFTGYDRMNPPLPAFTAPTQPGIYRMRFVQDWCSIDPAGDNDGKYGDFKDNGGQIVDVMLEVLNHVYLTDGKDYTNATEQVTDRITYTREFKNTEWQAWYVPFDIDYDAISDDFTAASLNAVHQYDDDDDGVFERWTLEILKLKSGDVIRANMPYMIRAKETGEHKFVVENAILYPAEENSLDCSSIRVHYTFKGNYSLMDGQVLRDNGWFAPGGGSLVTPSAGSNLKAYRWLLMPEARGGYETFFAPKRINIVIGDEEGELTAIEEVPLTFSELWPADVYDLNGRLVKAQAENLDNLPKGIYLVNGKKIVK